MKANCKWVCFFPELDFYTVCYLNQTLLMQWSRHHTPMLSSFRSQYWDIRSKLLFNEWIHLCLWWNLILRPNKNSGPFEEYSSRWNLHSIFFKSSNALHFVSIKVENPFCIIKMSFYLCCSWLLIHLYISVLLWMD